MTKKLALFPMTKNMCAVVRYLSLLQGYVLSHLLIPNFMGLTGEDISRIDGGTNATATLADYSKELLVECDTLFVDYDESLTSLSLYNEAIQDAKELGKEVILSRKLIQQLQYEINETKELPISNPRIRSLENDYLQEIRIPVITVLTQGERADQFIVELALRKHFLEEGYKVSQIGSHEASQLFGFSSLPDFLFESRDIYDKTMLFNDYVKELTDKEQSHLLILGVSGGTMKYSNRVLNDLGFLPFIACTAVRSDLPILCMFHSVYKESYFDEMFNHGRYKLGSPIRFFNISNTCFLPELSSDIPVIKYVDVNSDFVMNSLQTEMGTGEYHVFNALNNESMENACKSVQEMLTNNVGNIS